MTKTQLQEVTPISDKTSGVSVTALPQTEPEQLVAIVKTPEVHTKTRKRLLTNTQNTLFIGFLGCQTSNFA